MNEIAIYNASVPDRMRYAEALSGSSLLPRDYVGKPANVLLAIEYGAALGIPPMTAIQGVHVINGKPTASAGLIGALVRKAGHRLRVTGDDRHAVCEIVRGDDPDFTFRSEWTIERAQQAKLTGKDTWKNFPAAMLKARAITECARDACPEALAGVAYTPEELGDDGPHTVTTSYHEAEVVVSAREVADAQPTADALAEFIEGAVVVEETPGAVGGGEAPTAPRNRAGNRDSNDPASSQPALWKALQASLAQWQKANDATRADVLLLVASVVDREVASTKELSVNEAHRVLDSLGGAS